MDRPYRSPNSHLYDLYTVSTMELFEPHIFWGKTEPG